MAMQRAARPREVQDSAAKHERAHAGPATILHTSTARPPPADASADALYASDTATQRSEDGLSACAGAGLEPAASTGKAADAKQTQASSGAQRDAADIAQCTAADTQGQAGSARPRSGAGSLAGSPGSACEPAQRDLSIRRERCSASGHKRPQTAPADTQAPSEAPYEIGQRPAPLGLIRYAHAYPISALQQLRRRVLQGGCAGCCVKITCLHTLGALQYEAVRQCVANVIQALCQHP